MYAYIDERNRVAGYELEFDERGLSIAERHSDYYVSLLIWVDDGGEPPIGYIYDPETNTFSEPPDPLTPQFETEPEPIPPDAAEELRREIADLQQEITTLQGIISELVETVDAPAGLLEKAAEMNVLQVRGEKS